MPKKQSQKPKLPNDTIHVLVLIAGTTDPINSTTTLASKAKSYGLSSQDYINQTKKDYTNVPVNYWDKRFKIDIEMLDDKYANLVLFPFHGWTGDNSKDNREIAGQYLVNRLCGANGQKPYYEKKYQSKEMYFHLLGHSHGGNVINEMTKQIDKLGSKWPKKWKIKSLTYLSTPFFNKIHQVKVSESFFHKDAEVFHAFNKYDLTQRMLADFSLEPLADALENLDITPLKDAISNTIKLMDAIPFKNLKEFHFERGGARYINHNDGLALYKSTIEFFNKGLSKIFEELINLCTVLNKPYAFEKIDTTIKGNNGNKPNNTRQLIKDPIYKQIKFILSILQGDIQIVINSLNMTLNRKMEQGNSSKFDKADYFKDMFELDSFFFHLIDLIDVDSESLISKNPGFSLWENLCSILKDNIASFDNTYANPTKQFKGTFLEHKISFKEVTKDDLYNNSFASKNFDKFINKIELIEKKYEANPNQINLLDLLFTLLAQDESLYKLIKKISSWKDWLDYGEYVITGDLDKKIKKVRYMLENIEKIFDDRYCSLLDASHKLTKEQIKNNEDNNPYNNTLKRGELMYLLVESHSTSRRWLHKEVKEFLEKVGAKK